MYVLLVFRLISGEQDIPELIFVVLDEEGEIVTTAEK
jgi:hypothetical protein